MQRMETDIRLLDDNIHVKPNDYKNEKEFFDVNLIGKFMQLSICFMRQ